MYCSEVIYSLEVGKRTKGELQVEGGGREKEREEREEESM